MRYLLLTVLAILVGCTEPEPIMILDGARSGTPPLTLSESLVTQGGNPVPYRLVSPSEHCMIGGDQIGTEAARTIEQIGPAGQEELQIQVEGRTIGTATCEVFRKYDPPSVKVRY